jgi:hypothetical protein
MPPGGVRSPEMAMRGASFDGRQIPLPQLNSGTASRTVPLSSLVNPSLGAPGSLMTPWTQKFVPPTAATEQNDPGYQFRLNQGEQALQNSAAARGDLLSGNTLAAAQQYGQDYASNEYSNVYNRALGQYDQSYNIFQQNQANRFNRLAAMSGMGQTAAGQLSSAGTAAAGNIGNILLGSGAQIGGDIQNAAYQTASGYTAGGNAWNGALGNLGNLAMMAGYAKQFQGGGGGAFPGNPSAVDENGFPINIGI